MVLSQCMDKFQHLGSMWPHNFETTINCFLKIYTIDRNFKCHDLITNLFGLIKINKTHDVTLVLFNTHNNTFIDKKFSA